MTHDEIMANRPFEIGDWIYFKEHTGKQVVTAYIRESRKVYTEDSGYAFNEDDISYIRTPRKGSKEARDIVAMLASLHRKHLKQISQVTLQALLIS